MSVGRSSPLDLLTLLMTLVVHGMRLLVSPESSASDTERAVVHWKLGGAEGNGIGAGCQCQQACSDRVGNTDSMIEFVGAGCVISGINIGDCTNRAFPGANLVFFSQPHSTKSSLPVPIASVGTPNCFVGLVPHMPWVPDLGGRGVVCTDVTD